MRTSPNAEQASPGLKKGFDFEPKDISLITVSKDMDLSKALLVVLRRMLGDENNVLLLLSETTTEEFLTQAQGVSLDLASALQQGKLQLVDCVTRIQGREKKLISRNVLYASSPSDLSDIAIKVAEASQFHKQQSEKWLVLDSLTALTLYNTVGGILRFMQFLFAKLRVLNFDGVIIVLRDESSSALITNLKQYCNKIIFLAAQGELSKTA